MSVNVSPLRPLQAALYQRLADNLDGVTVVDGPREAVDTFPRVVVGEATSTPRNTHQTHSHSTVARLHVWSRQREHAEANQIASDAVSLLDKQPLPLGGGWHTVGVHHETTIAAPDPDPDIRHTVIQLRIHTEHRSTP